MDEFRTDLFNAIAEVMFKYRDYPVGEPDRKEDVKKLVNKIIDDLYEFDNEDEEEE